MAVANSVAAVQAGAQIIDASGYRAATSARMAGARAQRRLDLAGRGSHASAIPVNAAVIAIT